MRRGSAGADDLFFRQMHDSGPPLSLRSGCDGEPFRRVSGIENMSDVLLKP